MSQPLQSISELTKEFAELERNINTLKRRKNKVQKALLLAATAHLKPRPKRFDIGGWKCELSPIGHCVYDSDAECEAVDGGCLFCEEPNERQ